MAQDMHWSAYNSGKSSTFPVYREAHDPEMFWATEAEFYLDSSDPSNYDKLPQSPFYTWGLRAITAKGSALPLTWTTHGDTQGDVRVNCSWSDGDGGHSGTQLAMPMGSCPVGFSRKWDSGCNSYCGCSNADGTRKVSCDYCCQRTGSACHRAKGPSYAVVESSAGIHAEQGVPPGRLAQSRLPSKPAGAAIRLVEEVLRT